MAHNPISARRLPVDDPFFNASSGSLPADSEASQPYSPQETHESSYVMGYAPNTATGSYSLQVQSAGHVMGHTLNTAGGITRPEAYSAGFSGHHPQTPGRPYNSQETTFAPVGGYFPQVHGNPHGNPQHQPGWDLVSPPISAGYFPRIYANEGDWDLVASPTTGGLAQTHTNPQELKLTKSPPQEGQPSSAQPKSVKHLTCWYWANKRCRLPDHACLYSHFDTGRLADPPVQVQRGRPAVAGKNATNPQPVYKDWKGHHGARSAIGGPQIQKQIKNIYTKAAHPSTLTPVKAEQLKTAHMVKEDGSSSAGPVVNFNRAHPDESTSPAPVNSYRSMSIGIGASNQPRQMGGNFMTPSPAAHYSGGSAHFGAGGNYGVGGNHGAMGGSYGMGGGGPAPHHFGGNNPNNPNTPVSPDQPGGRSGAPIQEMQKQIKVKDRVITELAGIVEMLEINYGISIDDQVETFQKFMNIASSIEEEARGAGNAASTGNDKGNIPISFPLQEADILTERASDIPAPRTSAPQHGQTPATYERVMTAMEGSLNLIKMEKSVLSNSKARKQAVGGDLENVQAMKLLPRGWLER